jgi:hypothetical protein
LELYKYQELNLWCHDLSFGLATKVRVCKGVGQEGSSGVTFHAHESVGKCEGMSSHIPKWTAILGISSLDGLLNF